MVLVKRLFGYGEKVNTGSHVHISHVTMSYPRVCFEGLISYYKKEKESEIYKK